VFECRLQRFGGGLHRRHRGVSSRFSGNPCRLGRFPQKLPLLTNDI
jgi:hypothetical protein